jgi:hypothetical protein
MYTNKKRIADGYRVVSQTPIDDRLIKTDLADLIALGTDDYKAYEYYEGMQAFVVSENAYYKWVEDTSGNGAIGGFTYPAGIVNAGVTYSNRTFDFVKINFAESSVISDTYTNIETLALADSLIVDATYKITDRADLGLSIKAATVNSFEQRGYGIFLNLDFQNISLPLIGKNSVDVWHAGLAGLVADVSVAFWDGISYLNLTGAVGTQPDGDAVNWLIKDRATDPTYYTEETCSVSYSFTDDSILIKEDNRFNIITANSLSVFQFGNNNVVANVVDQTSQIININQRGSCYANSVTESGGILLTNAHRGNLSYNSMRGYTVQADLNVGTTVSSCTFSPNQITYLDPKKSYSYKHIRKGYSNFDVTLDMTDPAVFAAGVLDMNNGDSPAHVGIVYLDDANVTITKILSLQREHKVRFYPTAGRTHIFTHTAVAGLANDQLVSNVVGNITLVGTNGDFVEYEYADPVNGVRAGRKVNDSIAA